VNGLRPFLRAIGSLWLAALLLLLVMVAMACATIYEATHGTPQAQAVFYGSRWFQVLLVLLGVNLIAAAWARWPWSFRQSGFAITHVSVVVILLGAWVTQRWAVHGQVGLAEKQTAGVFRVPAEQVTLRRQDDGRLVRAMLDSRTLLRAKPDADFAGPILKLDDLQVHVTRYLPASRQTERVVNDAPQEHHAAQIALWVHEHSMHQWVFADHPTAQGAVGAVYHWATDPDKWAELIREPAATQPASVGNVAVTYEGQTFRFPLESCTEEPVPLGDTGRTIQVLRYIPHAVVGNDRQVRSASTQPINPAIEVAIAGPDGTHKRLAFARFPDFQSMHGTTQAAVRVVFEATQTQKDKHPIELFSRPGGPLYVRFNPQDGPSVLHTVKIGQKIDTPWPGVRFEVTQELDHARIERSIEPADENDDTAVPALRLDLAAAGRSSRLWIQKNTSHTWTVGQTVYEITYADQTVPLGFQITLDRFRIGRYPGTQRPRSFESSVTFRDPTTGREQSQVISMNHPAKHGGYTFFQSSYRQDPASKQWISYLSVSWDPGQPIVFAGYIGMLAGMIWVVVIHMTERRKTAGMNPSSTSKDRHT